MPCHARNGRLGRLQSPSRPFPDRPSSSKWKCGCIVSGRLVGRRASPAGGDVALNCVDRHGCLGCRYARKAKTHWRIFQKGFLHATHSNQAASLPCRPSPARRRHQCGTCSRSPISALGHPVEAIPFLTSPMSDVHETRPCLRAASMRRKGLPRTSCLADHCRAADLDLVLHRIMVCT